MGPDDLLCSRNARSRTPLVGRAQWNIYQAPALKRKGASLEGSFNWGSSQRPSCSQNAYDERAVNGTHVGPVLPERAP
jgi:hypothetical protein